MSCAYIYVYIYGAFKDEEDSPEGLQEETQLHARMDFFKVRLYMYEAPLSLLTIQYIVILSLVSLRSLN